jgi:mRNA interferase MazF
VWWAALPEATASEPGYRRPVLILQADDFNRSRIQTTTAVTLSSNLRLAQAPGNILIKAAETGLAKDSVANVSWIITIDRSFLVECVGRVSDRIMLQVEDGVRLVLDL